MAISVFQFAFASLLPAFLSFAWANDSECAAAAAESRVAATACAKDVRHGEEISKTVCEIGPELLVQLIGREPTSWQEKRLAPILASIGEKGDYGEITRLHMDFANGDPIDLIVKRVNPKPITKIGFDMRNATEYRRFLKGFLVEARFYTAFFDELAAANFITPYLWHATQMREGEPFTLVLEDLSPRFHRGANGQVRQMSSDETRAAIRWLARFHARFWEKDDMAKGQLWTRGSYWHLDELGELEFAAVPQGFANRYMDAEEWRRLSAAARSIDARLAGRNATMPADAQTELRHRTLVHGDAKPENILCSGQKGRDVECAGLDFAWVGEGYGMYDVMYLLWDKLAQSEVDDHLKAYRETLLQQLPALSADAYTPHVMKQHFELCVVDFIRWQVGFRDASHFWAMPWAMTTLRDVLARLDDGVLLTEEEYAAAVEREFPL